MGDYDEQGQRQIEKVIGIGAPVEAVWDALTTERGLTSWLAPKARVEPGVGGSIDIAWEGVELPTATITEWEPNRRLRSEARPPDPHLPVIAEEWTLESKEGTTIVRLVHSGFAKGTDWDDSYDAVDHGWTILLGNLQHWLEHHRGATVRQLAAGGTTAGDGSPWVDLVSSPRRKGDEISIDLDGPEPAVVTHWSPGMELAARLPAQDDARLVVSVTPTDAGPFVGLALITYDLPDDRVDAIAGRLSRAVGPAPAPS